MSKAYTIHYNEPLVVSDISFKKIVNPPRCCRSRLVLRELCTTLR